MCPVRHILGQQSMVRPDYRYIQSLGDQGGSKTKGMRGRYLNTVIFFFFKYFVKIPDLFDKRNRAE